MARESFIKKFMTTYQAEQLQRDYFQALVNLSRQKSQPVIAKDWRYGGREIEGEEYFQSCAIVRELTELRKKRVSNPKHCYMWATTPQLRAHVPKMLEPYIEQGKVKVRKLPKLGRFYHATLEEKLSD